MNIKTSYSRINEESIKQGDCSETGWVDQEGVNFESLDDAIDFLNREGAVHASGYPFYEGVWYSTDFMPFYDNEGTQDQNNFHLSGFSLNEQKAIYDAVMSRFRK